MDDIKGLVETPDVVKKLMAGSVQLTELFPGDEHEVLRRNIVANGGFQATTRGVTRSYAMRPTGPDSGELISVGAVARNPGAADSLIRQIDDFARASSSDRQTQIDTYWRIYRNEGLINNAVKKLCALIARPGSFKVSKAKKGKKQKAKETLLAILNEFSRKVNAGSLTSPVTGYRGIRQLVYRAARNTLVEGDWFGRQQWIKHEVPEEGQFSLPMVIQSISSRYMETDENLIGLVEQWFWAPPSTVINTLTTPNQTQKRAIKRFIDPKLLTQLVKDRRVELDAALLMHLQNDGTEDSAYGQSFIVPALFAIVFKRAVENLDLVSINNLVNRMVILKVGSSKPESPYREPSVQLARANKMVSMVEDPGPNMLLVWQGDDVEVIEVSAHEAVLDLNERHSIGNNKVKLATGLPDIILGGTNDGSKASGMAAVLAAQSVADNLRTAIAQMLTELGERIAIENGFVDFEVSFEFDNSPALDVNEEWNQLRSDYQQGTMGIEAYLRATGRDPHAMFLQRCEEQGLDPNTTLWVDAFKAPLGLPGQGTPPGADPTGKQPDGRPRDPTDSTQERPPEAKTPQETS